MTLQEIREVIRTMAITLANAEETVSAIDERLQEMEDSEVTSEALEDIAVELRDTFNGMHSEADCYGLVRSIEALAGE